MLGNREESPSQEWPILTERHWYAAAFTLVIIGLILSGFAATWVIAANNIPEMKTRTEIIAPFGTVFLALITFCTVCWRGMVTSRQADQQRRQNDANDEANLAKLLQEGAKLLGDRDKQPQVLAGIATLEVLVRADASRQFAAQAMDVLADFYISVCLLDGRMTTTARRALSQGKKAGVSSTMIAQFVAGDEEETNWPPVSGLAGQHYLGGYIRELTYAEIKFEASHFTRVKFLNCNITDEALFYECKFVQCKFNFFVTTLFLSNNFAECDFSGCLMQDPSDWGTTSLNTSGSFYYDDDPPCGIPDVDWSGIMEVRAAAERELSWHTRWNLNQQ